MQILCPLSKLLPTTWYSKIITEEYGQLFQQTQVIITAFLQIFYSETMETTLVTGITKASTICMYVCM